MPGPAQLVGPPPAEGQRLQAGDRLIELRSPDLASRLDAARNRLEGQRWQAATAGFDSESRSRLQSSQEALETAQAEYASLQEEAQRYAPRAPFAGTVRDVDPDLAAGQWLSRNEKLAVLLGEGSALVETYLDEESVKRIRVGDGGIFMADGRDGPTLPLTVTRIDADATRVLPNNMLSAQFGGHILTRERAHKITPEQAVYRVTLAVDGPAGTLAGQAWRGQVVIRGSWQAPAWPYLRHGFAVLLRETGF